MLEKIMRDSFLKCLNVKESDVQNENSNYKLADLTDNENNELYCDGGFPAIKLCIKENSDDLGISVSLVIINLECTQKRLKLMLFNQKSSSKI